MTVEEDPDAKKVAVPYNNSDTRAQQAKLNGIYKRTLNVSVVPGIEVG